MVLEDIIQTLPWDFTLANYGPVWEIMVSIGLILICLLFGNMICKVIPFLRKSFIPSALIGGLLLLGAKYGINAIGFACGLKEQIVKDQIMQVVTYHGLAIGFIATTLKVNESKNKISPLKVLENGAMTGGTYMLQAIFGILTTIILTVCGIKIFNGSGIILPLAFGQGPGNALTWDIQYTQEGLMNTNGSFGLSLASIGFLVASIIGVFYINIFKKKGQIAERTQLHYKRTVADFETKNEIEDNASVDKFSIQIALVLLSYAGAFGIMCLFAGISKWTGIGLFNSIAWGFNFIWGIICATIIRVVYLRLGKAKIIKKKYINNYQMDRISGFAFDLMIVAGVAAIDFMDVKDYILPLIFLSIIGTLLTVIYVRLACHFRFKENEHEMFLMNFGTLTGTASNGMILLKEIDPNFETPTSSTFILSQFPAMVFVAPLLLLLPFISKSQTNLYIALGIFIALFIGYTVFLFVPKKKKNKPQNVEENKRTS